MRIQGWLVSRVFVVIRTGLYKPQDSQDSLKDTVEDIVVTVLILRVRSVMGRLHLLVKDLTPFGSPNPAKL